MRCDICGLDAAILTACRAGCTRLACPTCIGADGACDACVRAEQVAGCRPIRCDDLSDELIAALLSGADFGDRRLPLISEPVCAVSGEPTAECDHLAADEARP